MTEQPWVVTTEEVALHDLLILPWRHTESSNVRALAWCKGLWVCYKSGGVYFYPDMTRYAYDAVRKAESVGGELHRRIKGRNCVRVELEEVK